MSIRDTFDDHARVLAASGGVVVQAEGLAALAVSCLRSGGKIFVCGNGGSAADAGHFAGELVGRFARERRALPALALGADTPLMTALANDYGYETVFARQIQALAKAGDLVVVISTSGRSPSVLAAVRAAREVGCKTAALTGSGGTALAALVDVMIVVPCASTPRIQEIHELCLHAVASEIEMELFPEGQT
jgi:D-sedoheptulose 7-phosphate isomerase